MRCHASRFRIGWLIAGLASSSVLPALCSEKYTGYVEYWIGKTPVIDGQRVRVNGDTKFKGEGKATSFADLPLGYEIELRAVRLADGSLLARSLEARPNDRTDIERQLSQAFDEMEKQYLAAGRMRQTDEQGKVLEDLGPLLTKGAQVDRVRRIMGSLLPGHIKPEKLRVYVVDNPEWNAMAAPNYSIYVFSGLLKDMDDDEVAIVLGHELAHASYEHSRKQYSRMSWVQAGAGIISILAGEKIDSELGQQVAQAATMLTASAVASGYSRDHEDQADRVGLRYAYQAGYDVTKGPKLWKRFTAKYGDQGKVQNFFFGEHSRASKRAALLQQEIRWNRYKKPPKSKHAAVK
jgi:Zn-dependent protease with chaperone function